MGSCRKLLAVSSIDGEVSLQAFNKIGKALLNTLSFGWLFRVTIPLRLLQDGCKKPDASTLVLNGSLCTHTYYYRIIHGIYNYSYFLEIQLSCHGKKIWLTYLTRVKFKSAPANCQARRLKASNCAVPVYLKILPKRSPLWISCRPLRSRSTSTRHRKLLQ